MKDKYQERITCSKCKTQSNRDLELMNLVGQTSDLENPLNVVIVKKFKCKKCKENSNYTIDIVKKLEKSLKIANN